MYREQPVGTGAVPAGWVLVRCHPVIEELPFPSSLVVYRRSRPAEPEDIPLPVLPGGNISEAVELPGDVTGLGWRMPSDAQPGSARLTIQSARWTERTAHMLARVARTALRLSRPHRLEAGLTFRRVLHDLPGAYRDATSFRVPRPPLSYAAWIERHDSLRESDIDAITDHIRRFAAPPVFRVLVAAHESAPAAVEATVASLNAQLYRNFTCTVLDGAGLHAGWLADFNRALAAGAPEWVMLIRAGDVLAPQALYWYAAEIQARPDAAVVYADDDRLDPDGRRAEPRFKPDWSPEHLRATHYIGAAAVMRGSEVAAAGGLREESCRHGIYDLLLRVADAGGGKVAHVPAILLHRAGGDAPGAWEDPEWCAGVLRAHLARRAIPAEVSTSTQSCRRVAYRLPAPPALVSVVVPTRDAAALLRKCLHGLLEKTTYPRLEVLVVDNQSTEPAALACLNELAGSARVRVLRYDRPFNYSALNNFAADQAAGEMLCLLNNDVEVISPDWLEEMAGHLVQERVGAVGAKLCYPGGRVQHAGMVLGAGRDAAHLHQYLHREEPGYCHRAVVAHEVSAVTGACLLTWKRLYSRLGGLEKRLGIGFNDVDYCLRLREEGYRVVFTPHAELLHHESATRGDDRPLRRRLRAMREIAFMRRRWGQRLVHDPCYNLNLSCRRPDFALGETSRVRKPWHAG